MLLFGVAAWERRAGLVFVFLPEGSLRFGGAARNRALTHLVGCRGFDHGAQPQQSATAKHKKQQHAQACRHLKACSSPENCVFAAPQKFATHVVVLHCKRKGVKICSTLKHTASHQCRCCLSDRTNCNTGRVQTSWHPHGMQQPSHVVLGPNCNRKGFKLCGTPKHTTAHTCRCCCFFPPGPTCNTHGSPQKILMPSRPSMGLTSAPSSRS